MSNPINIPPTTHKVMSIAAATYVAATMCSAYGDARVVTALPMDPLKG